VRVVAHGGIYSGTRATGQWAARFKRETGMNDLDSARRELTGGTFWAGFFRRLAIGLAATFAVIGAWLAMLPAGQRTAILHYWMNVRVPAPGFRLDVLLATPLSVQIHVAAAVVGVVVGLIIIMLPKGTSYHRLLGWTWVAAMITLAATSIAMIADFRTGINALHIFTAVTVVSLWAALTGIRAGNVSRHAGSMLGLYAGLIIAGVFAFLPGRVVWQMVFGG
jgi:uncharacterized membrane protein